jgi:hypothetical protein
MAFNRNQRHAASTAFQRCGSEWSLARFGNEGRSHFFRAREKNRADLLSHLTCLERNFCSDKWLCGKAAELMKQRRYGNGVLAESRGALSAIASASSDTHGAFGHQNRLKAPRVSGDKND